MTTQKPQTTKPAHRRAITALAGVTALSLGALLSGCDSYPDIGPKYGAGCEERYQNIDNLLTNNPLVVTHEVTPCNGIPEDTDHNTTIVTAELHAETTAAQANNLLLSIKTLPPGSLAGSSHEGLDIRLTWGIKNTLFTLEFYVSYPSATTITCPDPTIFTSLDQYAAAPGIQHVTANCTSVTLDHGDLPAFPSTFVAKRSDFPDTLGNLEETFTIGQWWKIIIHPHNGWEPPTNYPFDQLLKTIEGNTTNWRNVDDHWNPTPTTLHIHSYADTPPDAEKPEDADSYAHLTRLEFDYLNGTDPGLDDEATARAQRFFTSHPGISAASMCGIRERGLLANFNGAPLECDGWIDTPATDSTQSSEHNDDDGAE